MESLKKYVASSFYAMALSDELKRCKITILTHAGIVSGTPITEEEPDKAICEMSSVTQACVSDYRKEYSLDKSQPLHGNDGLIALKNVVFKSGSTTFHFNFLTVFYDQIVGITISE